MRPPQLPIRQWEFLQAVAAGQPVVKNAATRKALEDRGLITVVGSRKLWVCKLTPMGQLFLAEKEQSK